MSSVSTEMKVIVITGGGHRVGKTTLASTLLRILPNSKVVKLGEHPPRADKAVLFMPSNTPYSKVKNAVFPCSYLILESGSILDDPNFKADLTIYLPAGQGKVDKPGSERRRVAADLVRSETDPGESQKRIASALDVEIDIATKIYSAIEAKV